MGEGCRQKRWIRTKYVDSYEDTTMKSTTLCDKLKNKNSDKKKSVLLIAFLQI